MGLQAERSYTYPVKLPPSIRQRAADVAKVDGISLNYFISTAIAEKMMRLGRLEEASGWTGDTLDDPN